MEKIYFVSLGCDKNLVDSEEMIGLLQKEGFEITDDETSADAVVINTCCFIGDAKEESINTIIELGSLKENGSLRCLVVCGCLAQRYAGEIRSELPEVDVLVGTFATDRIVAAVKEGLSGGKKEFLQTEPVPADSPRYVPYGTYSAALKIAEGCDKHCTYCIIPKIRGSYRSDLMESILEKARYLAERGVKELILVAQETTLYGVDLYGEKRLPQLLKRLCEIEGIRWIRLMYAYPEEITDELIEVMASEEKICHYIDMPVQSGSDRVLSRMGRRCGRGEILEIIGKLRDRIPDICIRTTLISGFPGESEEDHEQSLELIREAGFERLGVFAYSPEEGTPAFEMEDQVSDEVKERRRGELMELAQGLAFDKNERLIGTVMTVMVEGRDTMSGAYVCRSYMDAPDVDALVFVEYDGQLISGDFVSVRIIGSSAYDLVGEMVFQGSESLGSGDKE